MKGEPMTYQQHRVGFNTALAGILVLVAGKFGVEIANGVALAFIGIVVAVSVYFSPGWADRVGLSAYPAGLTAAGLIVLGWALPLLEAWTGITGFGEFTQEELGVIVGGIPFFVGLFTPAPDEDIDPETDIDRDRVGK